MWWMPRTKFSVVYCEKIAVTGKKLSDKKYYRYSGYVGGLREQTLANVLATKPERALINAVKGMLPRNRLGRAMLKKLKVYAGSEHPHQAQNPQALELKY
jgi:large subunit ribosomal protein L13